MHLYVVPWYEPLRKRPLKGLYKMTSPEDTQFNLHAHKAIIWCPGCYMNAACKFSLDYRGVLWSLLNIYDGKFCENGLQLNTWEKREKKVHKKNKGFY